MQLLRIGEEEKDSEEGGCPHKYLSFKCGIYRTVCNGQYFYHVNYTTHAEISKFFWSSFH